MSTLTAEEVMAYPQRLLNDARRGQADIVLVEGQPMLLTMPLGSNTGTPEAFDGELKKRGLVTKLQTLQVGATLDL